MNWRQSSAADMPDSYPVSSKWLMAMLLLALFLPLELTAQVTAFATVRGNVTDADGLPLAYVNVFILDTTDGAATAADGQFEFRTQHLGNQQIRATIIGFDAYGQRLHIAPGDTITVRIVLRQALVDLSETIVEADAYTTGDAETATLQTLEVVTTAGAAADIFQAIKTGSTPFLVGKLTCGRCGV